jgi:hypothetical protein
LLCRNDLAHRRRQISTTGNRDAASAIIMVREMTAKPLTAAGGMAESCRREEAVDQSVFEGSGYRFA